MAQCDVCGNEYHLSFEVIAEGQKHIFDSFECAIHKLAPECAPIAGARSWATGSRRRARSTVAPTAPGIMASRGSSTTYKPVILRLRVLFGIVSGTEVYLLCLMDHDIRGARHDSPVHSPRLSHDHPVPHRRRVARHHLLPRDGVRCRRPPSPRCSRPDGTIMHTELQVGDSRIMMAEATEQWRPMPSSIFLLPPRLRCQLQARPRRGCHVAHGAGRPVLR